MRKIDKAIQAIGVDIILHFLVGGWLIFSFNNYLILIAIAFLKELYDLRTTKNFDWFDLSVTILGGCAAGAILHLQELI